MMSIRILARIPALEAACPNPELLSTEILPPSVPAGSPVGSPIGSGRRCPDRAGRRRLRGSAAFPVGSVAGLALVAAVVWWLVALRETAATARVETPPRIAADRAGDGEAGQVLR